MDDIKTKATAVLKDYISQMRTAGFPDYLIKKKLLETGSVNVPNTLPENFGQSNWSGGLMKELQEKKYKPGNWVNTVPDPNNYTEYAPGGTANRVPTYEEFSNRNVNTGGFVGNQNQNVMSALQRRLQGYSGPTVGASQQAYEMGIVGLPQSLANEWIPQYTQQQSEIADKAKEMEDYENIVMQYPELADLFKPGASAQENAKIIKDYYEQSNYQEQTQQPLAVQQLFGDLIEAFQSGVSPTVEDALTNAIQYYGLDLSFDEINAIWTSAKKQSEVK